MSFFGFRKTQMVSAEEALPGRPTAVTVPAQHEVLHNPLEGPYPAGTEIAESRARTLVATQQSDSVTAQMNASQTATVRSTSAALVRSARESARSVYLR